MEQRRTVFLEVAEFIIGIFLNAMPLRLDDGGYAAPDVVDVTLAPEAFYQYNLIPFEMLFSIFNHPLCSSNSMGLTSISISSSSIIISVII